VGRRKQNARYPVEEEDIAEVVAMMTGIPVRKVAKAKARNWWHMADDLRKMVIGQDEASSKYPKPSSATG
jgi:ATP-dependent Clp protease ATP-binding subunit ClpC